MGVVLPLHLRCFGVLCVAGLHLAALLPQKLATNQHFMRGVNLFDKGQYVAAQYHLQHYLRYFPDTLPAIEARYYVAACALHRGQPQGKRCLLAFAKNYPRHPKTAQAYFDLGDAAFRKQNFSESLVYYPRAQASQLSVAQRASRHYRMGYAQLSLQHFAAAKVHFDSIRVTKHRYTAAANYYAGYIALRQGDYTQAEVLLRQAATYPSYAQAIPHMMMQLYYDQRKFKELLHYAAQAPGGAQAFQHQPVVELLLAEANFFLRRYGTAGEHYTNHLVLSRMQVPPEVWWRAGLSHYHCERFAQALPYFMRLAEQRSPLAQLGQYYAALLHVHEGNKLPATQLLDRARRDTAYSMIQEKAAFLYGKLNYDLERVLIAIQALERFHKQFPHSKSAVEAKQLLSNAYLHTKNYALAIHVLNQSQPKPALREARQKVTLYKGLEHFKNGQYGEACALLRTSLQHPVHRERAMLAQVWLADSLAAKGAYTEAIPVYQQVLAQAPRGHASRLRQAQYGLGYAYFNTQQYAQAQVLLQLYLDAAPPDSEQHLVQQAKVRLGDIHYVQKRYERALKVFEWAIGAQVEVLHAQYYTALIHMARKQYPLATQQFKTVLTYHQASPYHALARFQLAQQDFLQGHYEEAIAMFSRFIAQHPCHTYLPTALLHRAIAYNNCKKKTQAAADCRMLLNKFPTHEHAHSALLELQQLIPTDEFKAYLHAYRKNNPGKNLAVVVFEEARLYYHTQAYSQAIRTLKTFLKQYSQSDLWPSAAFLLARCESQVAHPKEALAAVAQALKRVKVGAQRQRMLRYAARLAQDQQRYTLAVRYYEQLQVGAKHESDRQCALEGLMRAHYALQTYVSAEKYAQQLCKQAREPMVRQGAQLLLGKVALHHKKPKAALTYWQGVVKGDANVQAAEAQYRMGQYYHRTGQYDKSTKLLFAFHQRYAMHDFWRGKAFLLIADNYAAMGNREQAKATLRSIIVHAPHAVLVQQAQRQLKTLEAIRAPTPSTVD